MKILKRSGYLSNTLVIFLVVSYCAVSSAAENRCDTKSLKINSDKAVVLFTAKWSGPDKKLIPVLDSVAKSFPEIPLHKIDVDESPDYTKACGLQAVPTIITFVNGQRNETQIGVGTREKVEKLFNTVKNN